MLDIHMKPKTALHTFRLAVTRSLTNYLFLSMTISSSAFLIMYLRLIPCGITESVFLMCSFHPLDFVLLPFSQPKITFVSSNLSQNSFLYCCFRVLFVSFGHKPSHKHFGFIRLEITKFFIWCICVNF